MDLHVVHSLLNRYDDSEVCVAYLREKTFRKLAHTRFLVKVIQDDVRT